MKYTIPNIIQPSSGTENSEAWQECQEIIETIGVNYHIQVARTVKNWKTISKSDSAGIWHHEKNGLKPSTDNFLVQSDLEILQTHLAYQ